MVYLLFLLMAVFDCENGKKSSTQEGAISVEKVPLSLEEVNKIVGEAGAYVDVKEATPYKRELHFGKKEIFFGDLLIPMELPNGNQLESLNGKHLKDWDNEDRKKYNQGTNEINLGVGANSFSTAHKLTYLHKEKGEGLLEVKILQFPKINLAYEGEGGKVLIPFSNISSLDSEERYYLTFYPDQYYKEGDLVVKAFEDRDSGEEITLELSKNVWEINIKEKKLKLRVLAKIDGKEELVIESHLVPNNVNKSRSRGALSKSIPEARLDDVENFSLTPSSSINSIVAREVEEGIKLVEDKEDESANEDEIQEGEPLPNVGEDSTNSKDVEEKGLEAVEATMDLSAEKEQESEKAEENVQEKDQTETIAEKPSKDLNSNPSEEESANEKSNEAGGKGDGELEKGKEVAPKVEGEVKEEEASTPEKPWTPAKEVRTSGIRKGRNRGPKNRKKRRKGKKLETIFDESGEQKGGKNENS